MQANIGSGLVGDAAAPYYTGEPGDVIAMGNDHFRHIVMISEVLTDESGNTADYLICSNTGDLCDFPAGAYFYTYQQLIKIHGWNRISPGLPFYQTGAFCVPGDSLHSGQSML